jgi:hypothetical protein
MTLIPSSGLLMVSNLCNKNDCPSTKRAHYHALSRRSTSQQRGSLQRGA